MSGTQVLIEIVLDLPKGKRAAWRGLAEASKLDHLAKLPADYGRLEIVETTKSVTARALFTGEAEQTAEMLIDAFGAAAKLGATGKGIYFVLVDYQREEAYSIEIGDGTSSVSKLGEKQAHAKHARLDAFLEATVASDAPAIATATATSKLRAASAKALAVLKAMPKEDVLGAWERIKEVTITTAGFAVTKKDEKRLLALFSDPTPKYGWSAALPLRLLAELDPGATTADALAVITDPTLTEEERCFVFETLAASTDDAALQVLQDALQSPDTLKVNAVNRALAFSKHPRGTQALVDRARAWLEPLVANPKLLIEDGDDSDGVRIMAALRFRGDAGCLAMLREIWTRFYEIRARIPNRNQTPARAARCYVEVLVRDRDRALQEKYFSKPSPVASLDEWEAFVTRAEAELGPAAP